MLKDNEAFRNQLWQHRRKKGDDDIIDKDIKKFN